MTRGRAAEAPRAAAPPSHRRPTGGPNPAADRRPRTKPARDSVLIDRQGRYGTSPAALFKPLLRAIQRALTAGDTTVALSGAKLNVMILALQKAIWVEEEVLPRHLHAFSALDDRGVSQAQRLRTVANRMLRRPDRDLRIDPRAIRRRSSSATTAS